MRLPVLSFALSHLLAFIYQIELYIYIYIYIYIYLLRALHQSVANGNKMVARSVILLVVLTCIGTSWLLEQPRNSLMEHHPKFQWFLSWTKVFKTELDMRDFRGATQKPSWLYHNKEEMGEVVGEGVPTSRAVANSSGLVKVRTVEGIKKVYGTAKLKGSQSYTYAFAKAVLNVSKRHSSQCKREAMALLKLAKSQASSSIKLNSKDDYGLTWEDAELDGVFAILAA
jgi:hypothetical protein